MDQEQGPAGEPALHGSLGRNKSALVEEIAAQGLKMEPAGRD